MKSDTKKKIVVIGGGNGSAIVLDALKRQHDFFDIFSVVSMSDSGGSSGRLRKEFNTLPPGDIMRAALALSKYDYSTLRKIFYEPRFHGLGEKMEGHNIGNLFLVLMSEYAGGFLRGLEALLQSVDAVGKVFPVSLKPADLVAELNGGEIVRTEAFIDAPKYNRGLKIKKVWLEPECEAYEPAIEAIKKADEVILAPGSLFTSLVATLLPKGIKKAIEKSSARLIYVAGNGYRADGETGPESLSGMVKQLENYLPRPLNLIVHNNHKLDERQKKFYQEKKWAVFDYDPQNLAGRDILSIDFAAEEGGLSSEKLSKILKEILI